MKWFAAIFAHVVTLDHAEAVRIAIEENSNADVMNALQTRANLSTSMENIQDSDRHSEWTSQSNGMKRLFLLGPPDSGTNLLERSLILNWEHQWKEQYVSGVWKHSMSDNDGLFKLLANESDMSDALILIMVRSPIAQMVSWYNAPYILRTCFGKHRPLSMVDQPCNVQACHEQEGATYPDATHPNVCVQPNMDRWPEVETRLFPLGTFDSSVEVYNSYLRQYRSLQKDPRFPHVHLVPYERLVYNPEAELRSIAEQMGWQIPKTISALASESKNHTGRHCKNRKQALKYLNSRSWLEHTDANVLTSMCNLLDQQAVEGLYESPGNAIPYSFDCSSKPHGSHAS
jgi:hypothetical protein